MTDQLSNLPLEVFQCILQTIADNNDCQSLFSLIQLLRVNRYLALVTVPYIYSNPFNGLASSAKKNLMYREVVRNFLRDDVLLAAGGGGELPKNVVWEFKPYLDFPSFPSTECDNNSSNSDTNGNNDNSSGMARQPKPRPLNYLAHLRHLDFTMGLFVEFILRRRYQFTEEDLAYVEGGEYMSHYRYLTSNDNHNGSDSDNNSPRLRHGRSDKKKVAWNIYETTLYRDTTWALAIPLLDRLESLTFLVSDMRRWIGVVGRLGRLETLEFVIDAENLNMNNNNSSSGSPSDNEQQLRSREHETIQPMIHFIKIHTGVFPGRLKTVNTSGRRFYQYFDSDWLADLQTQISRLLPPMDRPKALNNNNWARLLAHPEATNLGFVEEINAKDWMWRDRNVERFDEYPRFLERCRVLKRLDLVTPLGKGSFQWAVLEKKRALGGKGDLVTLVPLERVDILGYNLSTDEADAIAFAFSNTLQHLTIETTSEVEGPWPTIINIGRGWIEMPLLTHLTIEALQQRLVIDKLLLFHCPNLVKVTLTDITTVYECQDIMPTLPAHLGRVRELDLEGWPALTFHPETLVWATELKSLKVCAWGPLQQRWYIPPIEELNRSYGDHLQNESSLSTGIGAGIEARAGEEIEAGVGSPSMMLRPVWSWDWKLKQLDWLEFTGEFAFRFQFRMLRGCPALTNLILDISTVDEVGSHPRVLTRADFLMPITNNDTSETIAAVQVTKPKRVIAYSLTNLTMRGHWILEGDSLVPILLHTSFPKLRDFSLKNFQVGTALLSLGFTLHALVHCLRVKAKHVLRVEVSMPEPTVEERKVIGIVPTRGGGAKDQGLEVWNVKVYILGYRNLYWILKDRRKWTE